MHALATRSSRESRGVPRQRTPSAHTTAVANMNTPRTTAWDAVKAWKVCSGSAGRVMRGGRDVPPRQFSRKGDEFDVGRWTFEVECSTFESNANVQRSTSNVELPTSSAQQNSAPTSNIPRSQGRQE